MTNPSMINSVIKAFDILECIGESRSGYTLTQLVKNLNMSVGTVQRLTRTLVALQYLCKEPETKHLSMFLLTGQARVSPALGVANQGSRKLREPEWPECACPLGIRRTERGWFRRTGSLQTLEKRFLGT